MRNTQLLRYGVASLTILGAGLSAFAVACGDDDDNVGPGTTSSSSSSSSGSVNTNDSGTDAETGTITPAVVPAKLQLINAATDFGPNNTVGALRVCFKIGDGTGASIWAPGLPPLPNAKSNAAQPYPGLFGGTGGPVAGTKTDFTTLVITPYLMNAGTVAAKTPNDAAGHYTACEDLFDNDAGGSMTPGVDFWQLPDIPSNTLLQHNSYILALTGCTADATNGSTDRCGTDWVSGVAGVGNLKVTIFQVDTATTVAADKIGAQFIHLSTTLNKALAAASTGQLTKPLPAFTDTPADPTKALVFAGGDAGPGTVDYLAKTDLAQLGPVTEATTSFTANPNLGASPLAIPLSQIETFSFGTTTGTAYTNGNAYTVVALGEIGVAQTDSRTFHYIALPNNPTIPDFDSTK